MTDGLNSTIQPAVPKLSLKTLTYGKGNVRTVIVGNGNGETGFVVKDVLTSLGYAEASITNVAKMVAHVPPEWLGRYLIPTPSGNQEMITLNEAGLFFFLARSDKPAALPMQKWVAGEVLPAIRKTGTYSIQTKPMTAGELITAQARLAIEHENRIETLIRTQAAMSIQLNEIIQQIRPTAYSRLDLQEGKEHVPLWETSYLLGTGSNRLFWFLRDHGILISGKRSRYTVSQKYKDLGYFTVVQDFSNGKRPSDLIMATLKGRRWLHGLACRGMLDSILDHSALVQRATPAGCPPPSFSDFEPKP